MVVSLNSNNGYTLKMLEIFNNSLSTHEPHELCIALDQKIEESTFGLLKKIPFSFSVL
jgi:hypothetical protein